MFKMSDSFMYTITHIITESVLPLSIMDQHLISVIYNNLLIICRQKHSLNQVAQDSTVGLLTKAKSSGINISEVYVDTVGIPEKYQVS